MIPTSSPRIVERRTEVTKDTIFPTNNRITEDVQPPVVPVENQNPVSKPDVAPISAPMPNLKPSIPYPSRRNDEKHRENAKEQKENFSNSFNLGRSWRKHKSHAIFRVEKLNFLTCDSNVNDTELAGDVSISRPIGIAKDVNVKVGVFQFPADFVVIDFELDPRVPLILGRCFLKTSRALIDMYEGELTLRVGNDAVTCNLDQTSRYSVNYNDMTAKRIDVVELACEEYSQEVLGFSDVIVSGNPTPYNDLIVSITSPTLTPFGDSDFLLLEEADAFLTLADDPKSPLNFRNYRLISEYAFLEDNNKLPVIIAKYLSVDEKTALIKVLKSRKQAIAWKLSDIKGINPYFVLINSNGRGLLKTKRSTSEKG
ncbi:reverse transcriptase domain-containing protein [Tanacetum coccineum]